jgi:hypothetical protein
MAPLSRSLQRLELPRAASFALGAALALILAAYVVTAVAAQPSTSGVIAAAALAGIGGAGLLYAWRLGAGSPGD